MFALLLLVCIYIVLGFVLAWVAGIVAREEMEIKTGVLILVLTAILGIGAQFLLRTVIDPSIVRWLAPAINFGLLALMINLFGKLSWKHSFIIAAVFSAIIFVVGIGLSACISAA